MRNIFCLQPEFCEPPPTGAVPEALGAPGSPLGGAYGGAGWSRQSRSGSLPPPRDAFYESFSAASGPPPLRLADCRSNPLKKLPRLSGWRGRGTGLLAPASCRRCARWACVVFVGGAFGGVRAFVCVVSGCVVTGPWARASWSRAAGCGLADIRAAATRRCRLTQHCPRQCVSAAASFPQCVNRPACVGSGAACRHAPQK
jgi:hypothetical protein